MNSPAFSSPTVRPPLTVKPVAMSYLSTGKLICNCNDNSMLESQLHLSPRREVAQCHLMNQSEEKTYFGNTNLREMR